MGLSWQMSVKIGVSLGRCLLKGLSIKGGGSQRRCPFIDVSVNGGVY